MAGCAFIFYNRRKWRIYGSPFPPLNKNKKGNCEFLSHNSDVFFLAIASLHLAILTLFSEVWDINLQFWEKELRYVKKCILQEKSELWESRNYIYFIFLLRGSDRLAYLSNKTICWYFYDAILIILCLWLRQFKCPILQFCPSCLFACPLGSDILWRELSQ